MKNKTIMYYGNTHISDIKIYLWNSNISLYWDISFRSNHINIVLCLSQINKYCMMNKNKIKDSFPIIYINFFLENRAILLKMNKTGNNMVLLLLLFWRYNT